MSARAKTVVGVVALMGAVSAVEVPGAPRDSGSPGILAIQPPVSTMTEGGLPLPYKIGFESSEGFSLGPLNGQQAWQSFTATPGQPTVANLNPQSGTQHIRLVDTPAVANNELSGGFTPELAVANNQRSITKVGLSINNVTPGPNGGADYNVAGQETGAGALLSFRVRFQFDGNVQIVDDTNNDGNLEFVNTGVTWSPNSYMNLRVFHNPPDNQIAYWLNNTLIYQGVDGIFGGNDVSQVVLLSDNFFQPGESGDFDNLHVINALPGDANADGIVNLSDFDILAGNFGTPSGATWIQADFNDDGAVNLLDFDLLAGNFGVSAGPDGRVDPGDWGALSAAVPEPSIGCLVVALLPVMRLRRVRR